MRAWILLALSVTLSCGGKEEVGGTPIGSCTLGVSQLGANADQWSCASSVVDAAGMGPFQQCPANVGAGVSCAFPNDMNNDGLKGVITSAIYAPCLQCTGNGLGVVWTCSSQTRWEAGDVFSCGQ